MRRTRIRPVSRKRQARDRHYQQARQAVHDRADGQCEVLGPDCTGQVEQVHHKAGRGGPDPHRLDNLVGACSRCHSTVHAYPEWAYARGHSVRRNGKDVA